MPPVWPARQAKPRVLGADPFSVPHRTVARPAAPAFPALPVHEVPPAPEWRPIADWEPTAAFPDPAVQAMFPTRHAAWRAGGWPARPETPPLSRHPAHLDEPEQSAHLEFDPQPGDDDRWPTLPVEHEDQERAPLTDAPRLAALATVQEAL
jgi:hypothetical protein